MTYAIVADDGTETIVSKADFIASFDDLHPVYVNAEAGIAVRLPLTDQAETIADENRRFVEAEAKHDQRWAARTVELDKATASGAPLEVADKFDLAAFVEDAELLATLVDWLDQITQSERHLFVAQVLEGKTDRELAGELGIAHQNVNRRKQRVLEKLQDYLSSKGQI